VNCSNDKTPFEANTVCTVVPLWKRALDVTLILLMLPLVLPVAVAIGVVIALVSPGPILFRQERVGLTGRRFMCLKFRTMFVDAETNTHQGHLKNLMESNAPMLKLDARGDSRIIPFGFILRSSGLDELPQLINVLLGDMSLVGPRPCVPYESERYQDWQMERFDTLPGLTGLWQVSGKNKTTFNEMMELDIKYAREKTVWMDLAIIVKTPMVIIGQVLESRQKKSGGTPPGVTSRPAVRSANFSVGGIGRESKSPKLTAETQMN
jgi:lipopolysaccharide/colanic/teichoic acid biosynthesis glycosyltransferase